MIIEDAEDRAPRVGIYPSIALEIEWALAAASRSEYRQDHGALARLYDRSPGLADRVRAFWSDSDTAVSCWGFPELLVLAQHGGLLFTTDADLLIRRLEELGKTAPIDLALTSETDEDRVAILARLRRLRSSAKARQRYGELIGEVWSSLRGDWEHDGRQAVDAAIAIRRAAVAKGAPWYEAARSDCDFGGLVGKLVEELGPDGELAVVPAYFTHKGLILELSGVVVIGVRTDHSGNEARARTELLARRLKTIADPTRLAILHSLLREPRTITGISNLFSLAQPTVSNHVKQLRDAGLVESGPDGSRRELVVCQDTLHDLLEHLHGVLAPTPA
ncbi:MAG: ArsR/SmtB family transcription factor [Acidimicrobiales bacterium]